MATKILKLTDSLKSSKQNDMLEKFLNSVFDEGGRPYFVPDEVSLYDITCGNEKKIISRINRTYGVSVIEEYFHWPICKLIDFISRNEKGCKING